MEKTLKPMTNPKISDITGYTEHWPKKNPTNPNAGHCSQCGMSYNSFNNGYNIAIDQTSTLTIKIDKKELAKIISSANNKANGEFEFGEYYAIAIASQPHKFIKIEGSENAKAK